MTKQQLWGGRFEKGLDASAIDFSFSLSFDYVLLPYDIAVNKAHSLALEAAGGLTNQERVDLHHALDAVLAESEDALSQHPSDEDVHSFVERLVIEKVGDLGKKMHTGKSRNDQVATDVRLYLKDQISEIDGLIHDTMRALYDFADDHKETVFPGFTHLQIAQPVVLGHHVLAYLEKIKRDQNRFVDAFERTDVCPLGSAAMAGSNYPVDRLLVARELDFSDITLNSMDAVSDRLRTRGFEQRPPGADESAPETRILFYRSDDAKQNILGGWEIIQGQKMAVLSIGLGAEPASESFLGPQLARPAPALRITGAPERLKELGLLGGRWPQPVQRATILKMSINPLIGSGARPSWWRFSGSLTLKPAS